MARAVSIRVWAVARGFRLDLRASRHSSQVSTGSCHLYEVVPISRVMAHMWVAVIYLVTVRLGEGMVINLMALFLVLMSIRWLLLSSKGPFSR